MHDRRSFTSCFLRARQNLVLTCLYWISRFRLSLYRKFKQVLIPFLPLPPPRAGNLPQPRISPGVYLLKSYSSLKEEWEVSKPSPRPPRQLAPAPDQPRCTLKILVHTQGGVGG